MSDSDQPLDRLNYYNGQRLEAADLRVEQSYHIFIRQMLNRSLFTAGIAAGLEVTPKTGDLHKVVVSPGLALDYDGREIILLEARDVQVVGSPSTTEGVVFGNYLVIKYVEKPTSAVEDGCTVAPSGSGGPCGPKQLASQKRTWGGPTRMRADAQIFWRSTWPKPTDNQVVLAQVELTATCAVRQVHTNVRKYADKMAVARVHPFALEGEADIDKDNSKKIYFHIRGGRPDDLTLYLKGERFSTLFYTELGQHSHGVKLTTAPGGAIASHTHDMTAGTVTTADAGDHRHLITANIQDPGDPDAIRALETDPLDENQIGVALTGPDGTSKDGKVGMEVSQSGKHSHEISKDSLKLAPAPAIPAHVHGISGDTKDAGVSFPARTSGTLLTYVSGLQVLLDGSDYSQKIRDLLQWQQIGDGSAIHDFVTSGTGPLDLEIFGADLKEGQHILELRVVSGGGRVRYNLYVE